MRKWHFYCKYYVAPEWRLAGRVKIYKVWNSNKCIASKSYNSGYELSENVSWSYGYSQIHFHLLHTSTNAFYDFYFTKNLCTSILPLCHSYLCSCIFSLSSAEMWNLCFNPFYSVLDNLCHSYHSKYFFKTILNTSCRVVFVE